MDRWFEMRIQSLKEVPDAFLASPETELGQGVEFFRERVAKGGIENAIFAAFETNDPSSREVIAGTVGIVREHHIKAAHKAFIWGMYVQPEFRGKGVGRDLVNAAVSFARETMNVDQILLSVVVTRTEAKELYAKMGFKKWGTEPRAVRIGGEYFDEEYMTLFLR